MAAPLVCVSGGLVYEGCAAWLQIPHLRRDLCADGAAACLFVAVPAVRSASSYVPSGSVLGLDGDHTGIGWIAGGRQAVRPTACFK